MSLLCRSSERRLRRNGAPADLRAGQPVRRHGALVEHGQAGSHCSQRRGLCAAVFDAIHGADGRDPTARTAPFNWDPERPLSDLRVGYFRRGYESEGATGHDASALETLRSLGVEPVPIDLPSDYPLDALRIILNAEAAAGFDELTLSGRTICWSGRRGNHGPTPSGPLG